MADSFMQQDAGPSGAEHDFHLACRSFARIKLQNRLPRRFLGEVLGVFSPKKKSRATRPPPPELPRAELPSVLAMQETFMRASGCESSAKVPSEPITRILRSSSA